jgi:hypothetical protein
MVRSGEQSTRAVTVQDNVAFAVGTEVVERGR